MKFNQDALKILRYFFENPYKEVHLRELSRILNINIFSIKRNVDFLISQKLIIERRFGKMRIIKANMSSLFFKYLKIAFNLKKVVDSGLIGYLVEKIPGTSSITLFGSVAKGEDDKKSDIDILVIGNKSEIDLSKHENFLGKKINLIVMRWYEWKKQSKTNRPFYIEVVTTGISLYGFLPVVE